MSDALLSLGDLHAAYGGAVVALEGVSLHVGAGEIVALLGANGAGKTTTLRAVGNLLPALRGKVTAGHVRFDGRDITRVAPHRIVRAGLSQVLEGRHCFRSLSVEENLLTGAAAARSGARRTREDLDRIYALFPRLLERRRIAAGLVSGGEQQMAAIGRALMARPRMLVLDEPSMGLAPLVVEQIFAALVQLNADDRLSVLIAEQNTRVALRCADRAYVLEHGAVVLHGTARELLERDDIKTFYLGLSDARRRRSVVVVEAG